MEKSHGRKLSRDEIVHHKDHNKLNNTLDNLEIISRSNHANHHYFESGKAILCPLEKKARGSKNGNAVLNEEQVSIIKVKLLKYEESCREIARRYGVAVETIKSIQKGQSWKHIEPFINTLQPVLQPEAKNSLINNHQVIDYSGVSDGD